MITAFTTIAFAMRTEREKEQALFKFHVTCSKVKNAVFYESTTTMMAKTVLMICTSFSAYLKDDVLHYFLADLVGPVR